MRIDENSNPRCASGLPDMTRWRQENPSRPQKAASMNTELIACLAEAGVGVGDDQLHPAEAAGLQRAQDAVQNAPSSESPTSKPSTSRRPSAVTPVAITTAWDTTRRFTLALQ